MPIPKTVTTSFTTYAVGHLARARRHVAEGATELESSAGGILAVDEAEAVRLAKAAMVLREVLESLIAEKG